MPWILNVVVIIKAEVLLLQRIKVIQPTSYSTGTVNEEVDVIVCQ